MEQIKCCLFIFSYLVYFRDKVVYIRVWKTFPRLLYLDERCDVWAVTLCENKVRIPSVFAISSLLKNLVTEIINSIEEICHQIHEN